jgi:DNA repair protein RecN (Recombination protein N)
LLTELRVTNFAIIDDLTLEFSGGLNILTGETGAGKSILVDALGLLLGDRAHGEQVRTGASEAEVEAVFTDCGKAVGTLLTARGLAAGENGELIIRRQVNRTGRHRAYVNGKSAPRATLEEIGGRLVDIHGQHQHQSLLTISNHLEILDDYGQLRDLRQEFKGLFDEAASLEKKMEKILVDESERESRLDFLGFQLREIDGAGLNPGEEEELLQAREVILNAEKISTLMREAIDILYEGEAAAAGQVETAMERVQALAGHIPELSSSASDLQGVGAVIQEAVNALQEWDRKTEYDPGYQDQVEERLASIGRLKRKYGGTVEEILARREDIKRELDSLQEADVTLEKWSRQRGEVLRKMTFLGAKLSKARHRASNRLEKEVVGQLSELGMEKARFSVRLEPRLDPEGILETDEGRIEPWEGGLEEGEFMISTNPGEELKGLARVASGGELSRIMLALKNVLAGFDRVMSLIFDEIDTGIGGAHARVVGRKMKRLSRDRQVICITHLPQIAGLADSHFLVLKEVDGERTRVGVQKLSRRDRIREIARMIAGEVVTPSARQHAEELMKE